MVQHRVAGKKLGRPKDQRKALLRSLVRQLVLHERISTTEAKAKEARRLTEKVISFGKSASLHDRRLALAAVPDNAVISKLFNELGPRYADRHGGYVRIIKLEPRKGDGAPPAILELV